MPDEGQFKKVDREIEIINKKLHSGYGKASLRRIKSSLYLQATYATKILVRSFLAKGNREHRRCD
jgi:hypothetical protein